ncbi:hypothetical protein OHT59_24485 [Streptomyces sp. NBC_00243]|uniref:hypothetical protein n=1 Tax=Streptomyces sp. NBC_00243 TaxID=2975688 RepID=UPI002DDB08BF|nr:hypothetical protein [Streptomyces sp. NBC_00243]WRZ21431.1 hypothetical protein OHT59_24485 [Streptomyces sp. NBC_00243]
MKTTVSTHKLPGYGATLRTAKRLTEQAVRIVNRAVPGHMPDVEVTLTTERGMADLTAAAYLALAGSADRRAVNRATREAKLLARDAAACTIPRPDGGALVLVIAERHASEGEFAVTLVHELVHAMQFSRKNVIEQVVRDTRDAFGIERQSRRQARDYERLVEQSEHEALGHEYLANQLVPGATT